MLPSRFETGRPMLLAGLRRWYDFAEAPVEIPRTWEAFVARLPLPGQIGNVTYGATCQVDMEAARFEYMAAAEVETFEGLADDLGRMRVVEAHYAVFIHEGPLTGIRDTLMAACGWMESNGEWQDAHTPTFERYGPDFDPETGADTEIWLPVISVSVTGP